MSHSHPRGTEHIVFDAQAAETDYVAVIRVPHGRSRRLPTECAAGQQIQ